MRCQDCTYTEQNKFIPDHNGKYICGNKELHYTGIKCCEEHFLPYCRSINPNDRCDKGNRKITSKLLLFSGIQQ